jgi:aspartate racemase
VGDILAADGEKLRLAGADFFLLACNTVHTAARQVEDSVDLPFLHIVDPTAEMALAQGYSTVGLLGSRYTMYGDYFVGRLRERYGLNVIVAEGQHADAVHEPYTPNWPWASSCRGPGKSSARRCSTWQPAEPR